MPTRATVVEATDETPDEIDEQPTGATTVISETGGTLVRGRPFHREIPRAVWAANSINDQAELDRCPIEFLRNQPRLYSSSRPQ